MAREIVEVEEEKPKKQKKKLDLDKIVKVVSENKETIGAIAGVLLASKAKKTATSKKSTKKKSTKKSSTKKDDNDTLSTAMDIFGNLLKK